ncbi:MAG TPA: hypothetical protein VL359_00180 [bacterium]|nr:hypothetical protein [bacterium]
MNPQILKIKKGSVIYDDTSAQQQTEPYRPDLTVTPSRRRIRRRSIGPRASLFPLLIIAAALFLFFRLAPRAQSPRAVVAGWQVTLRATPYQGTLIVGLTFVSSSEQVPSPAPRASARVMLSGNPEPLLLDGALERSPMTLTGRFPAFPSPSRLQAQVVVDGSRVILSAPVPRYTPSQ